VIKSYSQKHEINYDEVFALIVRLETIRLITATATQHRWRIYQMDFKSSFLENKVCIEQPMSYEMKGHEDKVLKLNKALYGLKQTPRAWYSRIDDYFLKNGFVKYPHE
jgi:hypothetical protein